MGLYKPNKGFSAGLGFTPPANLSPDIDLMSTLTGAINPIRKSFSEGLGVDINTSFMKNLSFAGNNAKPSSNNSSAFDEMIGQYGKYGESIIGTGKTAKTGLLAEGIANTGILLRELSRGTSEPFSGYRVMAPEIASARQSQLAEKSRLEGQQLGYTRRVLGETGQLDKLGQTTASIFGQSSAINNQISAQEAERQTKQNEATSLAFNQNAQIAAQTKSANIQKQMQENAASGATITATMSQMADLNRQLANAKTQTETSKIQNDISILKLKLIQENKLTEGQLAYLSGGIVQPKERGK